MERGFILNKGWDIALSRELTRAYLVELLEDVYPENPTVATLPPCEDVFNAFKYTDLQQVKVVILGQDPYPTRGNAHGLAFSVREGIAIPASLKNIFKELKMEYPDYEEPTSGSLVPWARQGVLLLNKVLTVQEGYSDSHAGKGWEQFTREVLRVVDEQLDDIVYLLWGKNASQTQFSIKNPKSLVLTSSHPSPLSASRGFLGCGHFKLTNEYLVSHDKSPIDWQI